MIGWLAAHNESLRVALYPVAVVMLIGAGVTVYLSIVQGIVEWIEEIKENRIHAKQIRDFEKWLKK